MPYTILHIDSSPMGDRSYSRALSQTIVQSLLKEHPDATVLRRDLAAAPLPHLTAPVIGAFYLTPETRSAEQTAALSLSEKTTDELIAADALVLGIPMWNFGIPSGFKAWVDHVMRAGRTFHYTDKGPVGLLDPAKKVFIASARGGVYTAGPAQDMDFQEPYMKTVLGFMGLRDITFVRAEGVAKGSPSLAEAVLAAQSQMQA